jgi:hypothetical protein
MARIDILCRRAGCEHVGETKDEQDRDDSRAGNGHRSTMAQVTWRVQAARVSES